MFKLSPPSKPLDLCYTLPGSKSFTNRALIMAALSHGKSCLRQASKSDDSRTLVRALQELGVLIDIEADNLQVSGPSQKDFQEPLTINVGPAGTTMRFLTAYACTLDKLQLELSGSTRMHERPIRDLVEALKELGAEIQYLGKEGCPPLFINSGAGLTRSEVSLRGDVSSQYFTALLLIAPVLANGLVIHVKGEQISKSYIDMTIAALGAFGVEVKNDAYNSYKVSAEQNYRASDYLIEGDASGASYLFALAALSGGKVRVRNFSLSSCQGDAQFPRLLEKMGCSILEGEDDLPWVEVQGPKKLLPITCDMEQMPDTAQTLSVIAACADGESRITGLQSLKHKETDRLKAVHQELKKLGIESSYDDDSITIQGKGPFATELPEISISTYEDHRMAMSFAPLAVRSQGLLIEEPEVVNKSFPEFWDFLSQAGVQGESI